MNYRRTISHAVSCFLFFSAFAIFTRHNTIRLKKLFLFFVGLFLIHASFAQIRFSFSTGASLLRNFSPQQKFWAFGQGVQADFHVSKKETVYALANYHTVGKFTNTFTATAKASSTSPEQIKYAVTGKWKFRQVSLGWKHYLKGFFDEEADWNLYGAAGFGLLFASAENYLATPLDTMLYSPVEAPALGKDGFKRLTLDIAIGMEYPLGPGFFAYGDLSTSLPASDYPSPLFHNQNHVPRPLMLSAGIRILFGYGE